eukprot:m.236355 g.236355  ORF g.236355 m.236355 type:complete len:248 (+) comp12960_c0_seq1:117-860(+)
MSYVPWNRATWDLWHYAAFAGVVLAGLELLAWLVLRFDKFSPRSIAPGGKALETLSAKDKAFIAFNKLSTVCFTYHMLYVAMHCDHVSKDFSNITLWNTVGSYVAFHVIYDFFYTLFHRALHLRSLYAYVHKHHHRQVVPTRGNTDAVNVHPFEFVSGEYLHILCVYLVPCHAVTVLAFVVLGGAMASLNHTRFDIQVDGIFQVRYHDLHHRINTVNYGQYIMLWDRVFGSFQPYVEPGSSNKKSDD